MNEEKLLELRVTGVKEAASRARIAFFIAVLGCGTILITLYNNYFAWNRIISEPNHALDEWAGPRSTTNIKDPQPPASLSQAALAEWKARLENRKKDLQSWTQKLEYESDAQEARNLSDNQAISISLLGIKLGSADMDIFGALGLLMTSTYYLLCMRRMSGELGSLLSDVDRRDDVESRYLILGARQSYVLNAAVAEDVVYPDNLAPAIRRDFLAIRLSRGLFSMLTFLPSITALMILTSDWYYLLTQIPQSYGSTSWWWSHLGPEFKRQFIVMHTMAWIAGVGIFLMNSAVYRIQRESAARMNKAGIRRAAPVSPKVAKSSR